MKYQMKGEKRSDAFVKAFKDILQEGVEEGHTVTKVMTKTLNKSITERDYGSVETMHLVQGIPLVVCSRAKVRVRT